MNAGLPGTGIGGLFYIAGALWMPVHALWRRATGRPGCAPWSAVLRQGGIAWGIVLALGVTGWGLGWLGSFAAVAPELVSGRAIMMPQFSSAVRWATVIGSTGVLVMVISVVQLLRLTVSRPPPRRAQPAIDAQEASFPESLPQRDSELARAV
jgi:hypothetical protein